MSIDRYRAMEVFTRVVDVGSFSGAASALQMPNGRVTTVIQELEAHLGVRLLHRTTRRLSLTDDGTLYYQRALLMLQEMGELEGSLGSAVATPAGRLRVDVPAGVGRHVIAPALPEFFALYPKLELELGSSDRPVDLIAEGVDCVIRGGAVFDESLVARHLGHLQSVTCAAPSYIERHGAPQTLEDLQLHRFVNYFSAKTGRVFPFDFARGDEKHEINRPHWVAANDSDTYLAAGLAGMGLMQTPKSQVVRELLASGRLVSVLDDWNAASLPVVVMYPRNRHLTAKVRVFIEWVTRMFQRETGWGPSSGTPRDAAAAARQAPL